MMQMNRDLGSMTLKKNKLFNEFYQNSLFKKFFLKFFTSNIEIKLH